MDDPAEMPSKIFSVNGDPFGIQKLADEFAIYLSDTEKITVSCLPQQDSCAAKNLCPQLTTIGALGHHVVDMQFHRMNAITAGFGDMDRHGLLSSAYC